jgi:hypothetical protein
LTLMKTSSNSYKSSIRRGINNKQQKQQKQKNSPATQARTTSKLQLLPWKQNHRRTCRWKDYSNQQERQQVAASSNTIETP